MGNKSFYIITFGCQMNVYDSRIMAEILSKEGYKEVDNENKADIILVNTCSVREHAEQRAIGRIGDLQRLRKNKPNLSIGVVGCMAQNWGDSIKRADFVVGPSNYRKLPEIVKESENGKWKLEIGKSDEMYSDIFPEPDKLAGLPVPTRNGSGKTRDYITCKPTAFVPVMRGCDNGCAYCIVPFVRGRARSRPHKDILREIELLMDRGVKEVTLLGQSVNEYKDGVMDFPLLLRAIDKTGIPRLRFITSHPKYMSQPIIDAIIDCNHVCEWIHLPLQSGSTQILSNMGRGYTREEYITLVHKIREVIPGVSITTDIIVGFPGETDENFNETLEVIKAVKFDFAYMFKYSDRNGTKAYNMSPKIPEAVKRDRLTELINTQNTITAQKARELIGKTVGLLVEGNSKRGNSLYGRTRTNKVVVFNHNSLAHGPPKSGTEGVSREEKAPRQGDFVKVRVNCLHGWTPYGNTNGWCQK